MHLRVRLIFVALAASTFASGCASASTLAAASATPGAPVSACMRTEVRYNLRRLCSVYAE